MRRGTGLRLRSLRGRYSFASGLGTSRAGPDVITMAPRALLNMIETIIKTSKSDDYLAFLVGEAREFAQIYLLAKQRHKACVGTGEFMTLREEFKDTIDRIVRYCKEKKHLSGVCAYDADNAAVAIVMLNKSSDDL